MHASIDVIGDIHGHHDALVGLLTELGYAETRGAWRHADRTAVFLGDFIDRGPKQVEVVRTVRAMVDAGSAVAVVCRETERGVAVAVTAPVPRPARAEVNLELAQLAPEVERLAGRGEDGHAGGAGPPARGPGAARSVAGGTCFTKPARKNESFDEFSSSRRTRYAMPGTSWP
jgi:hypothetical protein